MTWGFKPSLALDLNQLVQLIERRFGYATPKQQYELLAETVEMVLDRHCYTENEFTHLLSTLPVDAPMVQALLRKLTNNETYFFRDQPTMDSLVNVVLPELIERRRGERLLRVWSAGCSTGEEIYTMSILLHERIPDFDSWTIELVGTDIDEAVLRQARVAEYGERALRATSEAARQRYFDRDGKTYRLRTKFRQGVRFEVHNLVDPNQLPPVDGRFDLILCRNVTIYFLASGLERIAQNLASALREDGMWIAAPSDPKPPVRFDTRVLPGMLLNTHEAEVRLELQDTVRPKAPQLRDALSETPMPGRVPEVAKAVAEARTAFPKVAKPNPLGVPPTAAAAPIAGQRAASSPSREVPEIDQAMRLANEGNVQAALELVRGAGRTNPLLIEPYLVEAALLESISDVDGAMAALRRVLYLDPNRAEAHVRLALLLQRRGESQAAIRSLRNAAIAGADVHATESDLEFRAFAARHLMRLLNEEVS
jgi:chemotaxis protein methyltransferase CheR